MKILIRKTINFPLRQSRETISPVINKMLLVRVSFIPCPFFVLILNNLMRFESFLLFVIKLQMTSTYFVFLKYII